MWVDLGEADLLARRTPFPRAAFLAFDPTMPATERDQRLSARNSLNSREGFAHHCDQAPHFDQLFEVHGSDFPRDAAPFGNVH